MSNHPERDGSTGEAPQDDNTDRRETPTNGPSRPLCQFIYSIPPVQRRCEIPNVSSEEGHTRETQEATTTSPPNVLIHPAVVVRVRNELENVDKDPPESEPVPAGPSWAEPSEVDQTESGTHPQHTGRHQLSGNVIEANQLVIRRPRANNEETQRTSTHRFSPYEYNRNSPLGDRLLRRTLYAHTAQRVIELVTQGSTITYPTPAYTAKPRPTPTYPTPPSPAYPQSFLQNPAASHLVQAQNIHQMLNSFYPHHTMLNFQTSLFIPRMPPNLVPLVRPETQRLPNNHQQSTTLLPHTGKPLDLSVPIRPLPTLIPIHPSLPVTRVYSGSGGTHTPNRGSPHTHAVTSISSNVVGVVPIQSSEFDNTENQTTTNQNVASTDCSLHSSNRTTPHLQLDHQSRAPDLLEHQQYQLWPLADDIETHYSVEVETTDYDDWLNMRSPDSTIVPDASKTSAPIPTSSSDTIVPVSPLTSATPSLTTLPPEKQNPEHK